MRPGRRGAEAEAEAEGGTGREHGRCTRHQLLSTCVHVRVVTGGDDKERPADRSVVLVLDHQEQLRRPHSFMQSDVDTTHYQSINQRETHGRHQPLVIRWFKQLPTHACFNVYSTVQPSPRGFHYSCLGPFLI